MVTWPSAAITTTPLRRTQITVVERMRRGLGATDFWILFKEKSL
jgi:hypothetical protein